MKRKYNDRLEVMVREHENCIEVNLERKAQKVILRLYPKNDGENRKSAIDFASAVAKVTCANWKSIARDGKPYVRPFKVID